MNSGLVQTILYFVSVVTGQALSFLLLPIVTRFLAAEAYGEYALATTVSGLVAMLASAWVRNVGMRFYYDALGRGQTRGFYVATAGLQALLFCIVYLVALFGMDAMGLALASPRVWISAGLAMVLSDQFNYATSLLRAEQRTWSFAIAEIGSGLIRFVVTLAGLYAGLATAHLLFDAASVGFAIGCLFALPTLWRRLVGDHGIDLRSLRELMVVGPRSIPFSVSAWLERLADRLVLQHFLGVAVVGVYSVGYVIGERIIASLVQAVFMMAWPRILAAWQQGGVEAAKTAIRAAQRLYAWLTVGPVVWLMVFGGPLTGIFAGPDYQEAATVVPIVAFAIWLGGFSSYMNRHMELRKQFGLLSGVSMAGAVVNVSLTILLVPVYGMVGAALGTLANYTFNAVAFFLLRDRELGAVHFRPFAIALAATLVSWLLSVLVVADDLPRMVVFAVSYAGIALLALRKSA